MMDFHAFQGKKATHVMTTHRGEADESPLQLVSAARVAYWQRLEVEENARKSLRKGESTEFLPGDRLPPE